VPRAVSEAPASKADDVPLGGLDLPMDIAPVSSSSSLSQRSGPPRAVPADLGRLLRGR